MGFIDWHGNKEDQYEEVLEFAKMKEKMETDNFGTQMKKKEVAKLFGVPSLVTMQNEEILHLLLKEKKGLDILYGALIDGAPQIKQFNIGYDISDQFYSDFLLFSVDQLFCRSKVDNERAEKFTKTILQKIFKIISRVSLEEHYQRIETNDIYKKYLSRSFELKSGNIPFFWQWIGYLAQISLKHKEAEQFIRIYQGFMMHLAYYINQLAPDADVGKAYAQRNKLNTEIIHKAYSSKIELQTLIENIQNPIFRIKEEEERKRREDAENAVRMAEETIVFAAEYDARRLAAEEERLQEEKERLERIEFETKTRAERLKAAQIEARESTERLKAAEKETKERLEQIRIAESEVAQLTLEEARLLQERNRLERIEIETKLQAERLRMAKIEAELRVERLKATESEVKERSEHLKSTENTTAERLEQIRQLEAEAKRLAELEKKERAECVRLADLEAKKRAELEIAERRFQAEIEAAERKKKFISLVKYAKIIPGYYVLDIEDDSDMVTAGRLYSTIKEKKIKLARIASIMPPEAAILIENGTIPLLPVTDTHINLWEHETLHYREYAEIYMAGPDGETINSMAGTLYITNQRIHIVTGSKEYNIASNYLKKAVLYDVMPEIIEFASARETFFIRTPNPGLTYQFVKLLLSNPEDFSFQDEEIVMNMEEMSIDFLKDPTLESYIYGVRTMLDMDMPLEMKDAVNEMVKSLGYLDLTLKKYPSHKENAYNFFEYYIPEAVKILYSYNEYEKAGLRAEEKNPVYEKVMVAVRKVADAAKQQVVDIYKDAITDTTARARALAEILGQDGYVDPAYLIR